MITINRILNLSMYKLTGSSQKLLMGLLLLAGTSAAQQSAPDSRPARTGEPSALPFIDSEKSYSAIVNETQAYFAKKYGPSEGRKPSKEEKMFARWNYFHRTRMSYPGVPAGGSLKGAAEYRYKLLSGSNPLGKNQSINADPRLCTNGPSGINWMQAGPYQSTEQDLGLVNGVVIDPVDPNILFAGSATGGLFKTTNGGATWTNVTDHLQAPLMDVGSIAINPTNRNHILISTSMDGIFNYNRRTDNYGNSGGLGVLISTDGGNTWATTSLTITAAKGFETNAVTFHPGGVIAFAVGTKDIYESGNGGLTWATKHTMTVSGTEKPVFIDLQIGMDAQSTVYASTFNIGGGPGRILRYSAGNPWTDITANLPLVPGSALTIDVCKLDQALYACFKNGSQIYIYKSTDKGNSWTLAKQTGALPCPRSVGLYPGDTGYEFEVSDTQAGTFYFGTSLLFRIKQNETSWTGISTYDPATAPYSTHADIRALYQAAPVNNKDVLIMGTDGGIAKHIDAANGTTQGWSNLNGTGLAITQFYAVGMFKNNNFLAGGAQDNGTQLQVNSTEWDHIENGDGGWTKVDYADDNILYVSNWASITKYIVSTKQKIPMNNTEGGSYLWRKFLVDPTDHTRLWYGNKALYMYDGSSWVMKKSANSYGNGSGDDIEAFAVAPSDPNTIYVAYHDGANWQSPPKPERVMKSTNNGTTWQDISAGLMSSAYEWNFASHIEVDPYDSKRFWISFVGYEGAPNQKRVIYSPDGGTTYIDVSNGLPPFPINVLKYRKGTDDMIYAGTDVGVYVWNKALARWECYNTPAMPASWITDIELDDCKNRIVVSTFGRGMWEGKLLPPAGSYKITSSQIWNTSDKKSFEGDLEVMPNATLTINGTVHLASRQKLKINTGAKVIFGPQGKFTDLCTCNGTTCCSEISYEVLGELDASSSMITLDPNAALHIGSSGIVRLASLCINNPNTPITVVSGGKLYLSGQDYTSMATTAGYDLLLTSNIVKDEYALNRIQTQGSLESVGSATLRAGREVYMQQGFVGKPGFTAKLENLINNCSSFSCTLHPMKFNNPGALSASTLQDVSFHMHHPAEQEKPAETAAPDDQHLKVIPNPSNGLFTIQADWLKIKSLEIVNMLGKRVFYRTNGTVTEFDLSNQPKGVYFIKLIGFEGEVKTQKLFIQ